MSDYAYYIAKGRSLEIAQKHMARHRAHFDAWVKLKNELRSPGLLQRGDQFIGLVVREDGVVPLGWRKGKYGLVPANSKAGRAIEAKLRETPPFDAARFSEEIIGTWGVEGVRGFRAVVRHVFPEELGDVVVLHVPQPCAAVPPDAERLLASAYWSMKEAAEKEPKP